MESKTIISKDKYRNKGSRKVVEKISNIIGDVLINTYKIRWICGIWLWEEKMKQRA